MSFQLYASTPPGFPSQRIVEAAGLGGWLGCLNLEYSTADHAAPVIRQLLEHNSAFTVALPDFFALAALFPEGPRRRGLSSVILTDARSRNLDPQVQALRKRGIPALVVVHSLEEALAAQSAGAEGLVARGNEAGGRVGEETTFILLQKLLANVSLPVIAQGGIGIRSVAACYAAGAAGVLLDWQLALCEESQLPEAVKNRILRMDGSETAILGQDCCLRYRAYARPGEAAFYELRESADQAMLNADSLSTTLSSWERTVAENAREQRLLLIGQDGCLARGLAEQYRTVGGVLRAFQREAVRQCKAALRADALRQGGPLAEANGTRFPILQGPMTRVSDRADFALAVAEGGALPFLALALMRGPEVSALVTETKQKLGSRPWGIGLLGFVPKELRDEQLEAAMALNPPFAVIAGGRPDQAKSLEQAGTKTYLHVPSPELLRSFLESGARKVIFEGRECGGHVGPRSSFVLWEQAIAVILAHLSGAGAATRPDDYHIVFAGGIHDAVSTAMVSAMSASLSELGVRVGVLLGTSYLFTEEAVRSGAITSGFQREAIACQQTLLLESGVGHATRCVNTPFGSFFNEQKRRLIAEGRSKDEIREALEGLNLGRLRIAAKGIVRRDDEGKPTYATADEETQRLEGMYMIGQVAGLRHQICTVLSLHQEISASKETLQLSLARSEVRLSEAPDSDIAIVGMSCVFPKAKDRSLFWQNILDKVNAIQEVSADRWDSSLYFDKDRRTPDKIYSRWGGFLEDISFDPVKYGMPPASIPSVEPLHLVTLELVREALADSGYLERRFDRERTSVVVGTGGGVGELGLGYGFRSMLPHYLHEAGFDASEADALGARLNPTLPEWTEDSFAGLLLNVAAGRVANRFDFGGTNYIVDAACATSLAAVRLATVELESRASDTVVVAGADTMQTPFGYLCFSKTQALSPTGECRTFDETADGIVISEGVAVAILKRLSDAERDGDRIYAVIRAVGASSDGKDKGLTAPRPAGQIRALDRAYGKAGFSAATVGLVEAHGTGTVVGDRTEMESLSSYMRAEGAEPQSCALGSVKSMIGHTKCTAGFAGLVKAAMALHHKVLPPTMGVTKPNIKANASESPFYINTETRPWMARLDGVPRRAGVSAFGFGGTNFHTVLEEYCDPNDPLDGGGAVRDWPAELFMWRGASAEQILSGMAAVRQGLEAGAVVRLCDLAAAVYWEHGRGDGTHCVAVVAQSSEDLLAKMAVAQSALQTGTGLRDPRGIYLTNSAQQEGQVAFMFPGQGSQRVNMLRDLALAFPLVRETFEQADASLGKALGKPLSQWIYPPPVFNDEVREANESALKQTNVAQPALGAAGLAVSRLLASFGIYPDATCGHSYGEFAALCAAGALSFEDLIRVSEARGRLIVESADPELGTMAAVDAPEAAVSAIVENIEGVSLANLNAPAQTVISGTAAGVDEALRLFSGKGINARTIPVACAFHSKLVAGARGPLREVLTGAALVPPCVPVYSNTTAQPHSAVAHDIVDLLAEHLVRPVRWADEVVAMYEAGCRIFIEAGPGKVLSGLVARTLGNRPHVCIQMDQAGRNGLTQLTHAMAQLAVAGVDFLGYRLFENRVDHKLTIAKLFEKTSPKPLPKTAWVIRHGKAVPAHGEAKAPAQARPKSPVPVPTVAPAAAPQAQPQSIPPMATPALNVAPNVAPAAAAVAVASAPTAPAVQHGGAADSAMLGHQQLLSKFLETHRNVMLSYLGARPNAVAASAAVTTQAFVAPVVATIMPVSPVPVSHAAPPPATQAEAAPAIVPQSVQLVPAVLEPEPAKIINKREHATTQLLLIVSERTGYPIEMLGLDLDLEAELGVDSIKRVEIFGALHTASLLSAGEIEGEIEHLSRLKTLREIVDSIAAEPRSNGTAPAQTRTALIEAARLEATPAEGPTQTEQPLTRLVPQVTDAPGFGSQRDPAKLGITLITDDGGGLAPLLSQELARLGVATVLLGKPDVMSAEAVKESLARVRGMNEPVRGLVHLAALSKQSGDVEAELDNDLRWLFHLLQDLGPQLSKEGVVLAATALGGDFAIGKSHQDMRPVSASVAGFLKSLSWEWTGAVVRVVDCDPLSAPQKLVNHIARELFIEGGPVEIGYIEERRITLASVPSPIESGAPQIELDRNSVVVATGGARGITAETAIELAKRAQPRLVLAGRTPLGEPEPDWSAQIEDGRKLKTAIAEKMAAQGSKPAPAAVESEWKRIRNQREIRRSLEAIKLAGSAVEYHALDVSDDAAFEEFLEGVYTRFGRIDGVIHGAGVIEDKLLSDKTPESFDRVLRPKVRGALTLLRTLRPATLKFLVFYSSVAARYGNRGQCDYAAANEILNKLAAHWNSLWDARVVSINWGPWDTGGGMVTPELKERFSRAGVQLVSQEAGRRALIQEILHGAGQAEVVWGGPIPKQNEQNLVQSLGPVLKGRAQLNNASAEEFSTVLTTTPEQDLYLRDHCLDGTPVLPFAIALELLTEIAAASHPGMIVKRVRDLALRNGVTYPGRLPQTLRVGGQVLSMSGGEISVQLSVKSGEGAGKLHYTGVVELSRSSPTLLSTPRLVLVEPRALSMPVSEAYDTWLFHGPLFQGIRKVEGMGANGIIASVKSSSAASFIRGASGAWIADPLLVDSGLQLLILWARTYLDRTPLPSRLASLELYGPLQENTYQCEVEIRHQSGNPILNCDLRFYQLSGKLAAALLGMEVTCSKALNRLGESHTAAVSA